MNYDIHCWVGKSASNKLYSRGLYNAIALDNAVSNLTVYIHCIQLSLETSFNKIISLLGNLLNEKALTKEVIRRRQRK